MPSKLHHELNKLRGTTEADGKIYTASIAALQDALIDAELAIKALESEKIDQSSKINSALSKASQALSTAISSVNKSGSKILNFYAKVAQGIWIYNNKGNKAITLASGNGDTDSIINVNTLNEFTAGTGITLDGTLIKDGKCDGRDVSTDGTKLDTIATNADVTGSNPPQIHNASLHTNRTRTFFIGSHYYTTGNIAEIGVELDASSDEKVAYRFQLPKDFISLTSIQVCWSEDAWDTNDHAWVLDVSVYAGVPPNVWNQHSNTDNSNILSIEAYEQYYLDYFTIASNCYTNIDENDIITVILNRDANNGSDTFNQDIAILGLKITYVAEE